MICSPSVSDRRHNHFTRTELNIEISPGKGEIISRVYNSTLVTFFFEICVGNTYLFK